MAFDPEKIKEALENLNALKEGMLQVTNLTQGQVAGFQELLRVVNTSGEQMTKFAETRLKQAELLAKDAEKQVKADGLKEQANAALAVKQILAEIKTGTAGITASLKEVLTSFERVKAASSAPGKGQSPAEKEATAWGKGLRLQEEYYKNQRKMGTAGAPSPAGKMGTDPGAVAKAIRKFTEFKKLGAMGYFKQQLGEALGQGTGFGLDTLQSTMDSAKTKFKNAIGEMDDEYRAFVKATGLQSENLRDVFVATMAPLDPDIAGPDASLTRKAYEEFGGTLKDTGITAKESRKSMVDLTSTIMAFRREQLESDKRLRAGATVISQRMAVLAKFGVSTKTTAGTLDFFNRALQMQGPQMVKTMDHILAVGDALDINLNQNFDDFVKMAPKIAMFGKKDIIKTFAGMQAVAKATGVEVSKLTDMAMGMDTFEGAAEAAGRLNAMLGQNKISVMELVHAAPDDKIKIIQKAMGGLDKDFSELDRRQQQVFAGILKVDVPTAQRMFSATTSALTGELDKQAKAVDAKDPAKNLKLIQDKLDASQTLTDRVNAVVYKQADNIDKISRILTEKIGGNLAKLATLMPEMAMHALTAGTDAAEGFFNKAKDPARLLRGADRGRSRATYFDESRNVVDMSKIDDEALKKMLEEQNEQFRAKAKGKPKTGGGGGGGRDFVGSASAMPAMRKMMLEARKEMALRQLKDSKTVMGEWAKKTGMSEEEMEAKAQKMAEFHVNQKMQKLKAEQKKAATTPKKAEAAKAKTLKDFIKDRDPGTSMRDAVLQFKDYQRNLKAKPVETEAEKKAKELTKRKLGTAPGLAELRAETGPEATRRAMGIGLDPMGGAGLDILQKMYELQLKNSQTGGAEVGYETIIRTLKEFIEHTIENYGR